MQVRTFDSVSVKASNENVEHAKNMQMDYEVKGSKLVVNIPDNAFKFASSPAKLKKALGF